MTDIQKDILVGLLFIVGILSLISGAFIISGAAFIASVFYSDIQLSRQTQS